MIALGITSPQDRDSVKAWVDGNADRDEAKKVYESLARLSVGEGWIWAPDHDLLKQVKFPRIKTLCYLEDPEGGGSADYRACRGLSRYCQDHATNSGHTGDS